MHLLHLNVHGWLGPTDEANDHAVRELLEKQEADAVSLVEVDERWGLPARLASLADRLGYAWYFAPAFAFGNQVAPGGEFGNAILSRSRLLTCTSVQLTWPSQVYDGTEPSEPRVLALVRLHSAKGADLWFGSAHLPKEDGQARSRALDRLLDLIPYLGTTWAICGDFNTPSSSLALPDGVHAIPNSIPTYPADQPVEAIDYCLLPTELADGSTGRILPTLASDHLALSVSL